MAAAVHASAVAVVDNMAKVVVVTVAVVAVMKVAITQVPNHPVGFTLAS